MRDPVELPVSHVVVDRATIVQHLLSDPTDPFSKQPLAVDGLIPRPDIKAAIEAWLAAARSSAGSRQ